MKAFSLSPVAHFTAESRRIPWQRFNFRNLVSPSLKEPSQNGSRQSATPLLKTRSCSRFPPTRLTPKFPRLSVVCSPRSVLPRATLSMSEPLLLLSVMALLHLRLHPPRRLLPPNPSLLPRRRRLSKHRQRPRRHPLSLLLPQHLRRLPHQPQHLRPPQLLRRLRPPPVRCCRRLSVASSPITASMLLVLPALAPMVVSLAPMLKPQSARALRPRRPAALRQQFLHPRPPPQAASVVERLPRVQVPATPSNR